MIDFLSITIDLPHTPFGSTRKIERKGKSGVSIKQFSEKVGLYEDAAFIYVTSKNDGSQINIRGCPLKPLQGHNIFGSDNVKGLGYKLISFVLDELDISATEEQHTLWKEGNFQLLELHITYRLGLESHNVLKPLAIHILRNASVDLCPAWLPTGVGVTLDASHGSSWMIYDKHQWMQDKRRHEEKRLHALFQHKGQGADVWQLLTDEATDNIRVELRLSEKYLKDHDSNTGKSWTKDKVRDTFMSELALLRLDKTPSLKTLLMLTARLEDNQSRQTYALWLHGEDLDQYLSKDLLRIRRKQILAAIGVDIILDKVPSKLPPVNLGDVFCEENIMPSFPDWIKDYPDAAYKGGDLAKFRNAKKRTPIASTQA